MSANAFERLGISAEGIETALSIKKNYKERQPLVLPGDDDRLLVPENLLNIEFDLSGFEDPLALAMMCTRDPESPMAVAAASRLCPIGNKTELVRGVVEIVRETSKHDLVKECLKFVTDNAFEPDSIGKIQDHAQKIVVESRQRFTAALRENLTGLLDGELAPRVFVRDFFELTETGNLCHDVRKKLVLSLLLSSTVRPSIKFLMLENFYRMPQSVRVGIVHAVLKSEPTRHTEIIKEELHYIISQERAQKIGLDINGRPKPEVKAEKPKPVPLEELPDVVPAPSPDERHLVRSKPKAPQTTEVHWSQI